MKLFFVSMCFCDLLKYVVVYFLQRKYLYVRYLRAIGKLSFLHKKYILQKHIETKILFNLSICRIFITFTTANQ